MLLARSGVSLLLGLAALAAAAIASADPPPAITPSASAPSASAPAATAPPVITPPPSAAVAPSANAAPANAASGVGREPLQVPADKEKRDRVAMSLHDEAWALYEEGRYRAAIEKLEAALRIDPSGRELVYNLALLHEKLSDLPEAAVYYRRYLETETDPKARARIQSILRRLEGAEREAVASAKPVMAPRVPPPRPMSSPPPPPPAHRPVRPWVVATGSLAGAALVVGTIFGFAALGRSPGQNPRTGQGATIDDLKDDARAAHADAVVADASFVVAIAAAGTATALYFATPRTLAPRTSAVALVALAPGRLGVSF